MFAGFWLLDAQFRMLAAFPMDDENDLASGFVNIGDNLGDQSPHQLLACPHRRFRCFPGRGEIIGKSGQIRELPANIWRLHAIEALPARLDALQCSLPGLL